MQRFRGWLRRSPAAGGAAVVLLLLAACGTSHVPTPKPAGTASPSASALFHASGFTTSIPAGWTDHTTDQAAIDEAGASGAVQMLLLAGSDGSASNEHIDVTTVAQPVPDDQLSPYLQSVAQNGATAVSNAQPFTLDGATGLFVTYSISASATPPAHAVVSKVQDMLINHGGQSYEIVLNTAQADFDAQLPALQHVLSSWHWTA